MAQEDIVNLALRRSLFFPAGEIYSDALAGFWDFGPEGETLRRKIVNFWRKELVEKEGFVEIHGTQILPKKVFEASGHLQGFNDPVVNCTKCGSANRADKLIEEATKEQIPESSPVEFFDKKLSELKIACPKCKGTLGKVKLFNMMMKLDIGATGTQTAYLRPETCQSIFLDFDRIYKTARKTLPLGIAQAGASFRNEIAPRNTLLRERELGQMEIEIFFNPAKINQLQEKQWKELENYKLNLYLLKDKKVHKISCSEAADKKIVSGKIIAYYLARVQQLYEKYGFQNEKLRFRELEEEARAFYAKETWDFEIQTSDEDWVEISACNYRTDYDMKRHGEFSKKDFSIKEEGDVEKFIPHIFEISTGIDRTFYLVLDNAFRKEKRGPEERIFLDLNPKISPYIAGIFPLMKKDGLYEKAHEIWEELRSWNLDVFFDEKGSIGKRYARIDEIGVPFGITVDYDTLKDGTVTLRDRNSLEQKRVKITELQKLLQELELGKTRF